MMLFNALFHQKIPKPDKAKKQNHSFAKKSSKIRRTKKIDVPEGTRQNIDDNANMRRVYSAQFNGNKKVGQDRQNSCSNEIALVQEHAKRKILHLKEKLKNLKLCNEEIINENDLIKLQYQELLEEYEQCQKELNKDCLDCELLKQSLEKTTNDYDTLLSSNNQLILDINMLKNVVYRLNVHMERYQEKLRKHGLSLKYSDKNDVIDTINTLELVTTESINSLPKDHLTHAHTPISWGSVNSHTLGPLLDAYQETLDEKEEIIQNYEVELSHFTGQLQQIVDENEDLHRRLTEDDECSAKLTVELDKVRKDLKGCKNENDLLIKKCALKQTKLEEVLQCYEQKVEQLRRDYNVMVEQYHKSRSEISTLKEKNKSLIDSQDEFKNERQNYISLSMHNSSVNECKKWYEELKNTYEQEKLKMKDSLTLLQSQVSELNKNIAILRIEKEDFENKCKLSEKNLKKMESKSANLQTAFDEIQMSRNACRKQLHKAMTFAKDLVSEQEKLLHSLHLRQQENKAVKQIGSDIASRMDSLKSQLKNVQRDAWQELSTVEQRICDQDSIISELKREHNEEIERLKEIIRQTEQKNVQTKNVEKSEMPLLEYVALNENVLK